VIDAELRWLTWLNPSHSRANLRKVGVQVVLAGAGSRSPALRRCGK
jgi:hypothetical protein